MVNDCLRFEISKLKARGAVFGSQRREGAKVRGMGSGDEPASIAAPRQSANVAPRGARSDGSRGVLTPGSDFVSARRRWAIHQQAISNRQDHGVDFGWGQLKPRQMAARWLRDNSSFIDSMILAG